MTPQFLKTVPGETPVITEADFAASPARLFKAWTEPDEIRAWFGGGPGRVTDAVIELRIGGAWRFSFNDEPGIINALRGEYLEIVPNRRLVFSWIHQKSDQGGAIEETATSQVTVEIVPNGIGARMTVRHEGIVRESGRFGVSEGWSYGLSSLIEMLKNEQLQSERVSS